ncbi:MAG: urea carboxylase [Cellvibrionaceae bacterium]|nr:urea carboxylase [Cellvibrionaceae bacterium]|tara:strand:- start:9008 stop:12625 length:3618 start_codon:yes stop_codon:yes gene_type:complete
MFNTILIANRGAIAVRIIRTLKRLGIRSVAVYADSDASSLHVRLADEAIGLGEGSAAQTYLDQDKILRIAEQTHAQAIHPGYGFLSENADFARRCDVAGIAFIGPTADQIEAFGLKHTARALAQTAQLPLLPGSDLLSDLAAARTTATEIGYPVMLKSTAGGGGIGMQLCHSEEELVDAFDSVKRLSANNFANDGVFLEKFIARARHIEVQIFGNGRGQAIAIGERDCSSQRRNQKVVEECPAPNLSDETRSQLHRTAAALCESINYRNAGTVEFIVDADSEAFYFLEVNTRLQVEHGVTEEVYGIDLVEWMVRLACDDAQFENAAAMQRVADGLEPQGHAIQVRLYAEDPYRDFQPCADLLSQVTFPSEDGVRVDTWVEAGLEISPFFDPMLAKVIVHSDNRDHALAKLQQTLDDSQLYGSETNLDYLRSLCRDQTLREGQVTTRYLNDFEFKPARIDVIRGGTQTTVQDVPGRQGYWHVGVPPSGPFDSYSFQLGNRLLGNTPDDAGLEITLQGPTLQFSSDTQIVITGTDIDAKLDGQTIDNWRVHNVQAGQVLVIGAIAALGARSYLCLRGGIQCPDYLGSSSTFTLGQFGGHNGRALRAGDVLKLSPNTPAAAASTLDAQLKPSIDNHWQLRVIYGPHGAPDFFTNDDIEQFFNSDWEVHYNSSRTGVRLIGPKPSWARANGGEAGLHPSNIHDNAYAFGTIDFTGDMPVILGPDGPSLGGFVCPATVIQADLWKLGQLRAGDKICFVPVTLDDALTLEKAQQQQIDSLTLQPQNWRPCNPDSPIIGQLPASEVGDEVVYRAAGDHFLLVEYGAQELDIRLRFRSHALMQWLQENPLPGLEELTPGIRSLQIHFDPKVLAHQQLLRHLQHAERRLHQQLDQLTVPSRVVHIPLSWDDDACKLAIEKYDQTVRSNAPWAPSNLEFIRRINGLESIQAVKDIVFDASYLVMGLGDVYLGAPVATPIDPRHRLVTTKYNPARTWTAENSVGIGGSYLCVYGMEGPGGYQFIGRTLQMWNRHRQTREFSQPWLLRFFDQIRFYEVSQEELQKIRHDFPQGRYPLRIEEAEFNLGHYQQFLQDNRNDIEQFTQQRETAFATELASWHASGQFNYQAESDNSEPPQASWPDHHQPIDSSVSGNVWQVQVQVGDHVKTGQTVMILESMKMEIPIHAPCDGQVSQLLIDGGKRINAGQTLLVVAPADE